MREQHKPISPLSHNDLFKSRMALSISQKAYHIPQKFNIDTTKNGHIEKEPPFPMPIIFRYPAVSFRGCRIHKNENTQKSTCNHSPLNCMVIFTYIGLRISSYSFQIPNHSRPIPTSNISHGPIPCSYPLISKSKRPSL